MKWKQKEINRQGKRAGRGNVKEGNGSTGMIKRGISMWKCPNAPVKLNILWNLSEYIYIYENTPNLVENMLTDVINSANSKQINQNKPTPYLEIS